MCGELATAESAALEVSQEPKARGLALSRRTADALQAFSSAGRRRLIPVALSAVVLVCIASYFAFRSRTTAMPVVVPAAVSTSSQPNPQSAVVPLNVPPQPLEGVITAKPTVAESKVKNEDPADLWSRVRKGDAEAEVTLAKLYLSGVGVERSCEQAHVLLSAASRKQNKAADGLLTGAYAQQCP